MTGVSRASPPEPTSAPPEPPRFERVGAGLDDAALDALISSAALPPGVLDIDLSNNRLTAVGVKGLLDSRPRSMTALALGGNPIGDEGALLIAAHANARGISHLSLANTGLTSAGARALLGPGTGLSGPLAISLGRNPCGDAAAEAISKSHLAKNLQTLNLIGTGLTDAGAENLAVAGFTHLTHLYVKENALTEAGIAKLRAAPWAKRARVVAQ